MPWFEEAWIPQGPDWEALWRLAESQGGFFTNADARSCGVRRSLLSHYFRRNVFPRIHRGVYLLPWRKTTPFDRIRGAWMSAGRRSVVSHGSALFLHGLLDEEPFTVHLTIPRSRRGKVRVETLTRRLPRVRLHAPRAGLDDAEVTTFDGMLVTTVPRALIDTAWDMGTHPAVHEAIRRALARREADRAALRRLAGARGGRTRDAVETVLRALAGRRATL
jgi:predicted transcriptional regulator of viral defense system